ncbi:SCO family protein [Pseudoxanthomonas wuyuanensis]|uniref:Protein SCO1/2 n=1 Tax=Pseudoxanthomonas wuyuanensis TaxID=1073196 RepID=A0A286CZ88_9GAMM|nr:SCO family protein [Pseudoxanthomonas wuyuanensis]KAF1722296.1 SCO family protein [Pseudoxanthomonas wuyuanensis]SOD51689.1 protein SCO1/2 [Pseudoxanthomonas wuyuanensis]
MKLLLLLLAICLPLPAASAAAADLPGDSVYQLDAQLTDQDGRPLAWRDLRGRPRVVSMFYSHCHLMCPLIIESGKGLQKSLSADEYRKLGVAMISLDPLRDDPAALTAVAQNHRVKMEHWLFLAPAQADVRAIAGILDIRYRPLEDGSINHTSAWLLLDADGRIIARSEVTGVQPDPRFLSQVKTLLAAHPPTPVQHP